jgi:hypothetical protein
LPFPRSRRKEPHLTSDAKDSARVSLKGRIRLVAKECEQGEHRHPVRIYPVSSAHGQASLVEGQGPNGSKVGAMQKAREEPIAHNRAMRKSAKSLDAKGSSPTESAVA